MRFFILLCIFLSLPLLASAQGVTNTICTKSEDCRLLTFKDCCGVDTGVCIGPEFAAERFLKGMATLCKSAQPDCSVPAQRPVSCTCSGQKCVAVKPPAKTSLQR
jgi:hypothetical protein